MTSSRSRVLVYTIRTMIWCVGTLLTACGLVFAAFHLKVYLEDRQSEGINSAWEYVSETSAAAEKKGVVTQNGNRLLKELEFLHLESEGAFCSGLMELVSSYISGIADHECFFPKKERHSFRRLFLPGAALPNIRLPDATLRSATLCSANLENATLVGVNLRFADMRKAYLVGANFQEADLFRANLSDASMGGAVLKNSNLGQASLAGADLSGADLQGATLRSTNLTGAKLGNVKGLSQPNLNEACTNTGRKPNSLPENLVWSFSQCEVWREARVDKRCDQ